MAFELLPLKPEQYTLTFVPRLSLELPFFNLTQRKKDTPHVIKYAGRDEAGRPIRWEVYQDTSTEIGAPAVEAHEVWYLLVKPSIDSQRRPDGTIPEIIPLGGLRECLRKVGWTAGGFQARELIKALSQISFAGCVADLWVPTGEQNAEGKQKFLQIKGRFSRMSVYAIGEHHLTEEELAQSKFEFELEDILYISLNPLEAKLQQLQDRRILDNQYLFSLRPAARRWYELMAAKIFGVVSNKGKFCEIRYSWYTQHHHTLKQYVEHKRVRFQMDRIIKDHIESGYIAKVEYRRVKEPGQLTDYIIRYYPGPGATASLDRVQTHLRQRKVSRRRLGQQRVEVTGAPTVKVESSEPLSLSIVTAEHQRLMIELILRFGINGSKAYELVMSRDRAVRFQLEVWRFRQVSPRNRAGWMIQAIENNYDAPSTYVDDRKKQAEQQGIEAARTAIRDCPFCDSTGFLYVKSNRYPSGAMRQCSHDATIEAQYADSLESTKPVPDNAVEGPMRDEKTEHEKRPAEDPASP
ncbi:MAG TPA: hypothetical protein VJT15_02630 [Pyrinomonadaceae bacterium]|nr:hypothetical protein [Pyrinomonadaceae bacterium]